MTEDEMAEAVVNALASRTRFHRTGDGQWELVLSTDDGFEELSSIGRTKDAAIRFMMRKMREKGYSDYEIKMALGLCRGPL